jgi:hypothetical protein
LHLLLQVIEPAQSPVVQRRRVKRKKWAGFSHNHDDDDDDGGGGGFLFLWYRFTNFSRTVPIQANAIALNNNNNNNNSKGGQQLRLGM